MEIKVSKLKSGKIFRVKFIKKNGEKREMIARLGVTKHLHGGELSYDPKERNNLIVFSMSDKGYRTVNLDTVLEVRYDGKKYSGIKY